jgi:hypothetical protein
VERKDLRLHGQTDLLEDGAEQIPELAEILFRLPDVENPEPIFGLPTPCDLRGPSP